METPSSRYASRCAVCGKPARVFLGSTSYCQDCYNRLADYLAGVQSPSNDSYQILALDPAGHTVEFSLERYSFGARSVWTAVEQVPYVTDGFDPGKVPCGVGQSAFGKAPGIV